MEKKESAGKWFGRAAVGVVVLFAIITQEPWYGVILLVLAVVGILSYLFIRSRNRQL